MIYFPVKSLPNSANPSGFNRYKIRKNNPLHFQHLQNSSDLFILRPLNPPLESTLTRHLSLTPVQSTLTKNRGRGVVMVSLTKNSRNFVYPERLSQGATLSLSLPRAKCISLLSNRLRTLCSKLPGVPKRFLFWH